MSASAITSLGVSASLAPASTKSRTLGEEGEWEELKEEREEEEGEELEEEREEGTDLLDGPVPHGHGVAANLLRLCLPPSGKARKPPTEGC